MKGTRSPQQEAAQARFWLAVIFCWAAAIAFLLFGQPWMALLMWIAVPVLIVAALAAFPNSLIDGR